MHLASIAVPDAADLSGETPELLLSRDGRGIDIGAMHADYLDQMARGFVIEARRRLDRRPEVLDAGCGLGGTAFLLAQAGARVTAADISDYSDIYAESGIAFHRCDMSRLGALLGAEPRFDLVVSQRALHFLRAPDAAATLAAWRQLLRDDGALFLSVPDVSSEMGSGYPGRGMAIEERFGLLAPAAARAHNVLWPVCLYRAAELAEMMERSGFEVCSIFRSPHGDLKAHAVPAAQ